MSTNRTALNVVLAVLDIEQREFAADMGYDPAYVANVFNNSTPPSDAFKAAFGAALADHLLGRSRTQNSRLPARPLADYLARRAKEAPAREQFYADLGLSSHGWGKRRFVTEELVDRVCCELGVHPSAIYGRDYDVEEAS